MSDNIKIDSLLKSAEWGIRQLAYPEFDHSSMTPKSWREYISRYLQTVREFLDQPDSGITADSRSDAETRLMRISNIFNGMGGDSR